MYNRPLEETEYISECLEGDNMDDGENMDIGSRNDTDSEDDSHVQKLRSFRKRHDIPI